MTEVQKDIRLRARIRVMKRKMMITPVQIPARVTRMGPHATNDSCLAPGKRKTCSRAMMARNGSGRSRPLRANLTGMRASTNPSRAAARPMPIPAGETLKVTARIKAPKPIIFAPGSMRWRMDPVGMYWPMLALGRNSNSLIVFFPIP